MRLWRPFFLALLLLVQHAGSAADDKPVLRLAALGDSPPMSFSEANGQLSGFSIEIMRALCDEIQHECRFDRMTLDQAIEAVSRGQVDIAALALLDTPERRKRMLFSRPYFRSMSLWFARPGLRPGMPGVRVAAVRGSAQERYAQDNGWPIVPVANNGELGQPLASGQADAAIIPMTTAYGLMQRAEFRALGLVHEIIDPARLGGDACFAIAPNRPELKEALDAALLRIQRNGTYDRINSRFIPFRVN